MSGFVRYRALVKVNLGGVEPPEHIEKGEEVETDGKVVRRANGDEIKLTYPTAIQGAVNIGWLVPIESSETDYRPKPGGVEVHSAVSMSEKREKVNVMTVQDEERDLGSIGTVREAGAGDRDKSAAAKIQRDGDDGKVVGKIKGAPAKSGTVEVGKDDRKIVSSLDNSKPKGVEAVATGDVQEARTGDDLTELLPEAASTGRPEFKNENVTVGGAGSSIGGQDDGVVVGSVASAEPAGPPPADAEGALRDWVEKGEVPNPSHIPGLVKTVLRKLDAARSQAAVVPAVEVDEAPADTNGFHWDMSTHWKTRQTLVKKEYSENKEALEAILAVENSQGVIKTAQALLAELG